MKKNIKLFLLFLNIFIIQFFIFEKVYASETNDKYLIVDNYSIFKYQNNKWYQSSNFDEKNQYEVYINNSYFGKYYLRDPQKFTLYDKNNNKVIYDGELFAYSINSKVKNKTFEKHKLTTKEIEDVKKLLNMNLTEKDLSINECIDIDIDNNGTVDKIINISNLDIDNQEKYINFLYIETNSNRKQTIINESIEVKNSLLAPRYMIKYVINLENKKNDSIIIRKSYFSDAGETEYIFFENDNGIYEEIKAEQSDASNLNPNESTNNKSNEPMSSSDHKSKNETEMKNKIDKYALYIYSGILLIVFSIGYLIFIIMKNRQDEMDV